MVELALVVGGDVVAVVVVAGVVVENCHVVADEIPVKVLLSASRNAPVSMST